MDVELPPQTTKQDVLELLHFGPHLVAISASNNALVLSLYDYDGDTISENASLEMILDHTQDMENKLLRVRACFDLVGIPVIVVAVASQAEDLSVTTSVAYCYPEEKRCEILLVATEICGLDSVHASIAFDSQSFVLNQALNILYHVPAIGSPTCEATPISIDFEDSPIFSFVQLEYSDYTRLAHILEFPVLLHVIRKNTNLPSARRTEKSSDNSFLATLRSSNHGFTIQPCASFNRSLRKLPASPITHLLSDEGENLFFFATTSSFSSITDAGDAVAFVALESPVLSIRTCYANEGVHAVILHLAKGEIVIVDTNGNELLRLPPGSARCCIQSFLRGRDVLVIVHPTIGARGSNLFDWQRHPMFDYWASIPLRDLSQAAKSVMTYETGGHSSLNRTTEPDDLRSKSSAFLRSVPVPSGIDSLVIALEGRVSISKATLNSLKQRLEAKRAILARAVFLLSSYSSSAVHTNTPSNSSLAHFVAKYGLKPIVGAPNNLRGAATNSANNASAPPPSYFDIGSFRCVFVEDHYMVQLSITNTHPKETFSIRNLVAMSSDAPLQVSLVRSFTLAPQQTAILSASLTVCMDVILQPIIDAFFSIELELKASKSRDKVLVLPLGSIILDAQSPNQQPFLLSPYTSTVIATSPKASVVNAIRSVLSERLVEVAYTSESDSQIASFRDSQASPSGFGSNGVGQGMVVHTFSQGGMVCLEIGYYEPLHLVKFVQMLYREIPSIELQESPLTEQWIAKCSKVVDSLKTEIQAAISLSQRLDGSPDERKAYLQWKAELLQCQAMTDRTLAEML